MSSYLVAGALGAAAVLVAANYAHLADYAEYRASRAPYEPIARGELLFEPRVIEPLVNASVKDDHGIYNTLGYTRAVHNPGDDSVTLTFANENRRGLPVWMHCELPPEGGSHTQTYLVNQTFAYCCRDSEEHTDVALYQYRGTSEFRGARSFVFVHFEMDLPGRIPCDFPGYLANTVDIYDAGGFDRLYDIGAYAGPPEGASAGYLEHVEPIRHAVIFSPLYLDPTPLSWKARGAFPSEGLVEEITRNPDDSITVRFQDRIPDPGTGGYAPGANYTRTFEPGQTFAISCLEAEDLTRLHIYDYRGTRPTAHDSGDRSLVILNFHAYTRVPVPCAFPDFLIHSVDAFDTGRLVHQYDLRRYYGYDYVRPDGPEAADP